MHRATAIFGGAALVAALTLAACAPSVPHPGQARGSATSADSSFTSSSPAPLGSARTVSDSSGTKLAVTVEKVTDPASGASRYATPASGTHFAGVKLRVRNEATTTYQNNANNETTVVLSTGKTADANYNPIAGCGNFDNGQIKLKPGAAATGCVTFQLHSGDKVTEVRYGNTVFPGVTAQWRVP